jgi:hypothetical protein
MENQDHLLCFVVDGEGQVFIHTDAAGLDLLVKSLEHLRKRIDEGECEHDHLMTESWGSHELTEPTVFKKDGQIVHHVKIYGWTEEWAKKQGMKN